MNPELYEKIANNIPGPEKGGYTALKDLVAKVKAENPDLLKIIDKGGLIVATLSNLEKTVDHFGITNDRDLCCETILRLQRLKVEERPDYFNKVEDENLKKLLAMLDHFRLSMREYLEDLEKHATPEDMETFRRILNTVCSIDGNQKI